MKAVVQRVKRSSVSVRGKLHSSIEVGILILLGVHEEDNEKDAEFLADKCGALRIFDDGDGKMNLSLKDVDGSALVVSQFTLYGNARKGNRPNYMQAAKPELAERLYTHFVERLEVNIGKEKVATGVFREMMDVELVNDGPVTIIIETREHD
ncbi:MAG TPA: D-aminoacyl-tRNA deacylase [Candidatus Kryptobacter bacterium]|nr:MAG: D-tyrosyl-tRNA(Tyr) deacylase [Ignavibacteriae bacterium 37-53-5]HQT91125.1 D-aminoacyl-tRNA deacylase [Candidatus Kryptobacter bacterium]